MIASKMLAAERMAWYFFSENLAALPRAYSKYTYFQYQSKSVAIFQKFCSYSGSGNFFTISAFILHIFLKISICLMLTKNGIGKE
jgi:hypothetical protein